MEKTIILLAFLILLPLCSCDTVKPKLTSDHLTDTNLKSLLNKTIEAHGGLDAWNQLEDLTYTKKFSLFDAEGKVEKEFDQVHDYDFDDNEYIVRNVNIDGSIEISQLKKGTYLHTKNNQPTDKATRSIEKAINSSVYVIGVPFKLLDPGVSLAHEGSAKIDDKDVFVISATYDPGTNKNHSTKDVWWYYIDATSYRIVANKVKTSDHWAWIDNLTYDENAKILFNKHRKSYRIDSMGNKLFLRAEYFYDNYELDFD